MKHQHLLTVFEHDKIFSNSRVADLTSAQLKAFQVYHGEKGVPYFTLINNGVKFCEYVGILQIGNLTVEILPKGDKANDKNEWRDRLIGMLRTVGTFQIEAPSNSNLKLKANSILDLYFELFLDELRTIQHKGFIKKYRKKNLNSLSLKGCIQFSQHINRNSIHQERFFVKQTVYDVQHIMHQLIFKALKLIKIVNTNENLSGKISCLLLDFPEQSDIGVSEAIFANLKFDRKSEGYKKIIEISRLLLLNYHPDVSKGNNNVLALMFNMNILWERFVYASLKKDKNLGAYCEMQTSKKFWKPMTGSSSTIRPDIVLNRNKENCVVLDTKWKNLDNQSPSLSDLRQMFVYHEYYSATKVALVYPGNSKPKTGVYHLTTGGTGSKECSLIAISTQKNVITWQKEICDSLNKWIQKNNLS